MSAQATLRLDGVTKRYGGGPTAVESASLDVAPGEIVLVMGPSGSGKTTLLAMAGGLLRPTSGEIGVGSRRITDLSERELPSVRLRSIGFIGRGQAARRRGARARQRRAADPGGRA